MLKGERLLYNRLFLVCVSIFFVLFLCLLCVYWMWSAEGFFVLAGVFFVLKSDTMSTENQNVLCPTSDLTSR